MGCDIHPHIEVKINGKWEHYSIPQLQRCYALFTRICGVRMREDSTIQPISKPRGLPDDISDITRIEWEFDGGHSATWLNREELCALIDWHEEYIESINPGYGYTAQHHQWGYMTGNDFLSNPGTGSNPKEYEDVRFICWFDN